MYNADYTIELHILLWRTLALLCIGICFKIHGDELHDELTRLFNEKKT